MERVNRQWAVIQVVGGLRLSPTSTQSACAAWNVHVEVIWREAHPNRVANKGGQRAVGTLGMSLNGHTPVAELERISSSDGPLPVYSMRTLPHPLLRTQSLARVRHAPVLWDAEPPPPGSTPLSSITKPPPTQLERCTAACGGPPLRRYVVVIGPAVIMIPGCCAARCAAYGTSAVFYTRLMNVPSMRMLT